MFHKISLTTKLDSTEENVMNKNLILKIGVFTALVVPFVAAAYVNDGFTDFWKDNIRANGGELADVKENMRILKDDVRELKEDLVILKQNDLRKDQEIQMLRSQVKEFQNGVNTNFVKIDTLSTDNKAAIEANSANIKNNGESIVKHTSDIGKNQDEIEANDAEISNNTVNIDSNKAAIEANSANITNNGEAIVKHASAIATSIAENEATISQNFANIALLDETKNGKVIEKIFKPDFISCANLVPTLVFEMGSFCGPYNK